MDCSEITEKIIGCAYRVYNGMGPGFLENVYEKCLAIELEKIGLNAEFQKSVEVFYESRNVGSFVADILVEGQVIVELKAVRSLAAAHELQLVNYLAATRMPVGLLINFGETKVEVKRRVLSLSKDSDFFI
jgi:GxxExxY protein